MNPYCLVHLNLDIYIRYSVMWQTLQIQIRFRFHRKQLSSTAEICLKDTHVFLTKKYLVAEFNVLTSALLQNDREEKGEWREKPNFSTLNLSFCFDARVRKWEKPQSTTNSLKIFAYQAPPFSLECPNLSHDIFALWVAYLQVHITEYLDYEAGLSVVLVSVHARKISSVHIHTLHKNCSVN